MTTQDMVESLLLPVRTDSVDFDEGTRKCVGCRVTNEKQRGRCFALCSVFVPSINWKGFKKLLIRVRSLEALNSHACCNNQTNFQYFQINESNFTLPRNYVICIDAFNLFRYRVDQITSDLIVQTCRFQII
jgi:Na+-transporting NADH:ubiquinone oxidoreductase subunit NqrF